MSNLNEPSVGCNDVIMLITDGAPDYYKEVFEEFNANKTVLLGS
jgi:hypothetical protein